LAAGWARGGIDGALQLSDHFRHGAVQVASDLANASPVARFPRNNPNRLKQRGGGDVVGVGDKWNRHPATDGLIFRADLPHVPSGPGGENDRTGDRQQEGKPNSHGAPPRFSHDSI
jgi:hypothetical protein